MPIKSVLKMILQHYVMAAGMTGPGIMHRGLWTLLINAHTALKELRAIVNDETIGVMARLALAKIYLQDYYKK